jgi:hypothetical protein
MKSSPILSLLLSFWTATTCTQLTSAFAFSSSVPLKFNHDQLKDVDSRLSVLEQGAPASLTGFYEPALKSFSVKPGAERISITSTCFALQAVLSASAHDASLYSSFITMDTSITKLDEKDTRTPVRSIVQALLSSEWREEDMFQVPLLLYTVLKVDAKRNILGPSNYGSNTGMDEQLAARIRRLVTVVLSARPHRRSGNQQPYSDYILYQCAQCYSALIDSTPTPTISAIFGEQETTASEKEAGIGGLPVSALPEGAASQLSLAVSRCAEISMNELCRQLALRSAGDTTSFDVMRLAYSLLTYISSTNSLADTAGRELIRGEGPSPGTRISPINKRLVRAGLTAFFQEQDENSGMWDKGQPIYKSFRKTGRNVGNAFIFAVDTVSTLLDSLPAEEFRPHISQLRKTLEWIEFHQSVEIIPDYCDAESGQCYGKSLRGWASPHLSPETGPQGWSTAQTLGCVSRMRGVIQQLMHVDVLSEFQGSRFSKNGGPSYAAWDRLLDADLGKCGTTKMRTLKEVIEERMVTPLTAPPSTAAFGACYSAVLFGPPGTAKTTICEALAKRMGWDFLVIDTSVFLADGLSNVASRIRYVFQRLQSLQNCVILFDEIEEFCLDRETPGLGMESRMLTTAMLTAINDLRRAQNSVFFLATNRLRAFDSAITRPGRFDMQLFVGTPNLAARIIQLRQKLADVPVEEDEKQKALATYESFLTSVWSQDARFMNYLEGMQFARACANLVAQGRELTEEELSALLQAQAAVLTVRGQVREEFIASMELTRL